VADNFVTDVGSGGNTYASDDIGGVHYPIMKLAHGALDSATIVSTASGLPVDIRGGNATVTVTDDGSFTLAANSGVDIGDVDVTSIVPGTGATNLGKAIQTAQGATDTGVGALAVRNDLLADLAGADGDWTALQVDENGALYTAAGSFVSTNNSTTSTLIADAVFTGTGDDLMGYSAVVVTLDASHDSATDGMTFQFSTDNSNWDDVYTFTYTAANGARRFQFPVTARYFRIVYTNGGTGQTHFRAATILHTQNQLTTIHRIVNNVDPDRSAQLTTAAILAQAAGSGDFVPVQATAAGNFKVSVEEFSDGVDVGNGTVGSETLRVTIASDTTGVLSVDDNGGSLTVDSGAAFTVQEDGAALTALQLIDNVVRAEDVASAGAHEGNVVVLIRDDALAANAGVDADGDYTFFRANNDGALWVQPSAGNLGGCKLFTSVDLDESEEDPSAGATTIYSIYAWNLTAAPLWLQLFNTNTVTVGTTAPTNNYMIPANADSDGAGVVLPLPVNGLAYDTALTVAITTGSGTNAGAPGAGDAGIALAYQD
jgi:hypothetical protein